MPLFSQKIDNLLPYDGQVVYYGQCLDNQLSERYFKRLMAGIDWQPDRLLMFGKYIETRRKVAWYGEHESDYTYSGITKTAKLFTKDLLELKAIVEDLTGHRFNSCLLNRYQCGQEGMSWHADDEKELGPEPVIASISLGAARKFSFKHKKTQSKIDIILENGSLLLMKGQTQANWKHALPKTKKVVSPRINLTFRML